MDDNFSKEIRSALNRRDAVRFRYNSDTGVLERISPEVHSCDSRGTPAPPSTPLSLSTDIRTSRRPINVPNH
eukprot:IDg977t1